MSTEAEFEEFEITGGTIETKDVTAKTRTITVDYKHPISGELFSKRLPLRNLQIVETKNTGFHIEETFPLSDGGLRKFGFVKTAKQKKLSNQAHKEREESFYLKFEMPQRLFMPRGYEHTKK